ncbi:hypothetical protein L1049_019376 [Liquidambar formosana]|uniref:Branchpoint-bridging protein n=1 Tax=Liquidambar formosana TaxID=63359 RepID=A0AAP0X305_LIQFO
MDEPYEEPEEELTVEPSEECVPQLFFDRHNDKSEELEEDPEEETIEEIEELSNEDLEEEPIEEVEEDPEEDPSEDQEEDFGEEPEEDPEEEMSGEPEEEPVEQSLSNYIDDETGQPIKDPNPSEDSVSKLSYEADADKDGYESESVLNNSNEKKRSLDATAGESAPLKINQTQKKCRQEESLKPGSDFGFVVRDLHIKFGVSKAVDDENASEQQECMGSSEKRRRSRWDTQPEVDSKMDEGDRTRKKRKTRWENDDSQLKMLGPIQLPDFKKEFFVGSDLDPNIQKLKSRLLVVNSKLKSSTLHDDRPEEERSPSPQPVYNNLGIRINTREVRLREKLIQERQDIISRLIKRNPTFERLPDFKPQHYKKLYIPVKEYPEYNFIGLILGPRGNTKRRMEQETGARIYLRGKGSSKLLHKPDICDNEDLHVLIESKNRKAVDAAVVMVEKLLIPVENGMSEHKAAQLKELAKLKGTYKDENMCSVCGEQGHKQYACPRLESTFKIAISCDTCGGNDHPSATCPFTVSPHASNSLQGSSRLGLSSTPKTQNKHKETSDANLFVGYLTQSVDDSRLRELFTPFGNLTEVRVIKDRTTGLSKGYGFVKFENPADAAVAVTRMNGYKIDGKMLAVRVAGRPPPSTFSVLSHLPVYPGPAAVPQVVPSQTSWPGPPGSMLLEPQYSFTKSEGVGLPPSSMYIAHDSLLPKSEALSFSPSSGVSSLPDSMSASSMNSSFKYSNQTQFSSPISLVQFPGDPDYPGSQFQSYFTTPTVKPSLPYHFSHPPESYLKPSCQSTTHLP